MHNYDYKTKITVADLERRFNKGYGKYDPSCYGAPDCFVNAKTKEGQA